MVLAPVESARPRADRETPHALTAYLPRILEDWLATTPDEVHRSIVGTPLFADLSGFTRLTERLSRHGKIGAEEMSDALNTTFTEFLGVAHAQGADLVKWGGDAVMLLFEVPVTRREPVGGVTACGAASRGRAPEDHGRTGGPAHVRRRGRGEFHFFLVGDPDLHRELVICGPDVARVVELEGHAEAGEIAVPRTPRPDRARALRCRAVPMSAGCCAGRPGTAVSRCAHSAPAWTRPSSFPSRSATTSSRCPVEPEHRKIAVAFVSFSRTDTLLARRARRPPRPHWTRSYAPSRGPPPTWT